MPVPGRDGKCTFHPGDTLFVQDPCRKARACLGALFFVLLLCMTCMFDVREYRHATQSMWRSKGSFLAVNFQSTLFGGRVFLEVPAMMCTPG